MDKRNHKEGYAMLETGTKAPAFELPDQNGVMHRLEDYKGKKVILYFVHDSVHAQTGGLQRKKGDPVFLSQG